MSLSLEARVSEFLHSCSFPVAPLFPKEGTKAGHSIPAALRTVRLLTAIPYLTLLPIHLMIFFFLSCSFLLLTHVKMVVHCNPRSFSAVIPDPSLSITPSLYLCIWFFPSKVQYFILVFISFHLIDFRPFLWFVKINSNSKLVLHRACNPSQLGVISKLVYMLFHHLNC